MRLLFELDRGDHSLCTHDFVRPSARAILIRDGRIAMVHSLKYDYYTFPGGGIEAGEDPVQAVIRETLEEAGLTVIPGSVREYGLVRRVQRRPKDLWTSASIRMDWCTFPNSATDSCGIRARW